MKFPTTYFAVALVLPLIASVALAQSEPQSISSPAQTDSMARMHQTMHGREGTGGMMGMCPMMGGGMGMGAMMVMMVLMSVFWIAAIFALFALGLFLLRRSRPAAAV